MSDKFKIESLTISDVEGNVVASWTPEYVSSEPDVGDHHYAGCHYSDEGGQEWSEEAR